MVQGCRNMNEQNKYSARSAHEHSESGTGLRHHRMARILGYGLWVFFICSLLNCCLFVFLSYPLFACACM